MSNAAEQAKLEEIGSQIVRLLAGQLVYPCVLLTHTDVRRLRAASDLLAQRFDWPELAIGQQVSAALLGVAPRRWPRLAGQAMVDAVDSLAPGPILCGDIDLLFEPALEEWLLAVALTAHPADELPFADLVRLPELFPFRFGLNVDQLRRSPRFDVYRQGSGWDAVALRR